VKNIESPAVDLPTVSEWQLAVDKSSVVDCWFEPWLGQTKDYQISICCFSAIKHAVLRRKRKDKLSFKKLGIGESVLPLVLTQLMLLNFLSRYFLLGVH
jgi:hypothetical protein